MARLGSNASGLRRYNERLVLATIRRMKEASKTDIARETGLSPQAALRIVENLEEDGRLLRSGKRMGGKGQPSILYRINGASGLTVGVDIGRDKLACALLDFDSRLLAYESRAGIVPDPDAVLAMIRTFTSSGLASVPQAQRDRFMGFGIAMPWFLGEWGEEDAADGSLAAQWRSLDVEAFFRSNLDGPIMFDNDGNSAALAELHCGAGSTFEDFLYVHLGHFVGGGLVLGNEVRRGRHGNAASLASLPLTLSDPASFLIDKVTIRQMSLREDRSGAKWHEWYRQCVEAIAFAIISANSLLDLEAVILGGELEPDLMDQMLPAIGKEVAARAPRDFFDPELLRGTNDARAVAIGAALLPAHSSFNPNLRSLFKSRV